MIKFQEINLFLNFIDYFCDGDKIEKHFMRVILKMTPRHAFVYQYRGYSLNEAGRLGVRWMKVNLPIFHAFWGQIFCPKTLDFHFPVIFSVENSLANYWSENNESKSAFDLFELKNYELLSPISVCYQASDSTLGDNNAREFSLIYRNMSLWTQTEKNICKVE